MKKSNALETPRRRSGDRNGNSTAEYKAPVIRDLGSALELTRAGTNAGGQDFTTFSSG